MVIDSSKNDIDHGKHDKHSQENAKAAHSRGGWKLGVDAMGEFLVSLSDEVNVLLNKHNQRTYGQACSVFQAKDATPSTYDVKVGGTLTSV